MAQCGHWVHNHQSANTFLQLAHISLLFFGNCALKRHLHQFLCFFTQFLAMNLTQASNFCFQRGFLFFQLGIFVCGFNQRQIGLLVADGVQAIAETF